MIVLDASATVERLLVRDGRAATRPQLGRRGGGPLQQPRCHRARAITAGSRDRRRPAGCRLGGHTTHQRASVALTDFTSSDITLHDPTPLLARAWELNDNLTPYDAVYVALAEVLDATLVTMDARIGRAPGLRATVDVVSTT